MEKIMKEFIALHNRTVSRDEIQTVIALAKEQNNTEVIYRLSKILNDHPDSNRFNINIINYPQETDNQAGLAGTRHSGDYREALDECGRLKKGWHFVDGKVLKVQKRSGLLSQYTEKEFGHPFTKTLKAKFKELNWKYDRKNKRYYTPVPKNEAEKEQHARMFAFIEQEKSRIEANGNFTSAPSSAKSAPSDSSSNKTTLYETFTKQLLQIKNSNNDIPSNELEEFLYSFGQQYYKGKETPYKFWYSKEIKPIGTLSAYKNHPLFNKVKNTAPHHAGYITTKRGEEILDTLIEAIEAIKKQYGYDNYDFSKFWNIATEKPNDEIAFLSAAGINYFPEAPDDETQGLGKPVPAADIYKMVTDKIIGMLKSASPTDYHRAWKDDAFFIPLNYDSKKPYRGVNRLLLQERIGFAGAFRNPYFLTFKQIKKHKGTLKKGAKGYEVIYYSIRYVVPADKNTGRKAYSSTNAQKVLDFLHKYNLPESEVTRIPMIRYYNVYNGANIENIDFKLDELQIGRAVPDSATENRAAQLIVENYPNPPAIKHEGNQAYYNPASDYIKLPKQEQFDTVNDYYRTLFHELTHSTGHNKRLNRGIHLMLEKDDYAKEELVAEFGAVFLSAWAGIMWYTNKNHAVYLKNWNSAIKEAENDNKFLMRAASLAQQATDYILALDKDGNPAFLKKLQLKKAPKKATKSPSDKSAPSDSSSNKNVFFEEYRQLKSKYPEHLIIVSMEDQQNYTMYGKDAFIAADILNLQLLKGKGNDEFSNSVGFKYNYLREYLEKLVKAGYKVAVRENNLAKPFRKRLGFPSTLFGTLPNFKTRKEAKKYFKAWAAENLTGKKVYHKELDKYVVFSSRGIDHVLSSNISFNKMKLILQAEEMLKNSHLIAFEEDYKKRENIKGVYRMRSNAVLEGEDIKVILTLREGENGVIYYDHKIEEIKESTTPPRKSLANPFCGDSAPTNTPAKTVPNSALSAPRHAGILKEALTEKGKQKKGWYFQDYGIIDPKGKYHPLERDYSLEYNLIEKELRDRAFQQDEKRKIKGFEENKKLEEAIKVFLKELSKENKKHFKNSKAMEVFYWAFPFTLESNSTFYTFEESNPYINKNLQELDKYFSDDNELFERLENYETLRRYQLKSLGLHISAKISSFIDKQGKIIRGDSNKLNQKYGLSAPEVFVEHSPDPATQSAPSITPRNNSLANKMATLQNRTFETFIIAEPQMQAFLGDVERKNTGSTAITITGGAGSGKTRFAFQFINALAQNYKVGHASLEEQPDSKLYFDKVQQYLDQTAQANVEAPEIKNMQDLQALIERNDVIVIDSFTKIREWDRNFLLDRDLRKKYNGKLFLIIFQQTVAGNMRGGTTSEFDGDIILYTQVFPDYRENYIYPSKNRYNSTPSEQLRYSVYHQQLLPSESTPSDSSPVTSNTYEVIY